MNTSKTYKKVGNYYLNMKFHKIIFVANSIYSEKLAKKKKVTHEYVFI